jgi:hypothetical protein
MRNFRLATKDDVPQLLKLVGGVKKLGQLPDLACVAEVDGQIVAAVGLSIEDGIVTAGPGVIARKWYGKPFLVFRLHEFLEDFLATRGVKAYVCSSVFQNKRMQRWLEKTGAREYARVDGRVWYYKVIGAADSARAIGDEVAA